jgi:hypothetical protein
MGLRVNLGCFVVCASLAPLGFMVGAEPSTPPLPSPASPDAVASPACRVPLDALGPVEREHVRAVLDKPTLVARGPVEVFPCRPDQYQWLLDHPDQTARLWRCIGVACADIRDRGSNFSWEDGKGSHLEWQEVHRSPERRVWYAEGKINPGVLLPMATVRAVVVVHHTEGKDSKGRPAVRQRIEMALQTDSNALSLAARVVGASAPHLADQYVGQIQMFYGALAWYLEQHPRHAEILFTQLRAPAATDHKLLLPKE